MALLRRFGHLGNSASIATFPEIRTITKVSVEEKEIEPFPEQHKGRLTSHSARPGFVVFSSPGRKHNAHDSMLQRSNWIMRWKIRKSSHSSGDTLPRSRTSLWSGPERKLHCKNMKMSLNLNSSWPGHRWREWGRCWWWPWGCPRGTAPASSDRQRTPRPCFYCPATLRSSVQLLPAQLLACKFMCEGVEIRAEKQGSSNEYLNDKECGQMGVTITAGTLGWIMLAPAATA